MQTRQFDFAKFLKPDMSKQITAKMNILHTRFGDDYIHELAVRTKKLSGRDYRDGMNLAALYYGNQAILDIWQDWVGDESWNKFTFDPTTCKHEAVQGDNYGKSCLHCGTALAGYGFFGESKAECIHEFLPAPSSEPNLEICPYCEKCRKVQAEFSYDFTDTPGMKAVFIVERDPKRPVVEIRFEPEQEMYGMLLQEFVNKAIPHVYQQIADYLEAPVTWKDYYGVWGDKHFHPQYTRITFEDQQQDFLTWDIAYDGRIMDCKPFQGLLWRKYKVTNLQALTVGGYVNIHNGKEPMTIKYKIEKIRKVNARPKSKKP